MAGVRCQHVLLKSVTCDLAKSKPIEVLLEKCQQEFVHYTITNNLCDPGWKPSMPGKLWF